MVIQGQSDEPLNGRGVSQAKLLGGMLAASTTAAGLGGGPPQSTFSHVYASDLSRAYDTANNILHQLSPQGEGESLVIQQRKELRERCFGAFERRNFRELEETARAENIAVTDYIPDGGESYEDVYDRMVAFFDGLCVQMQNDANSFSTASPASTIRPASVRKLSEKGLMMSRLSAWKEEAASDPTTHGIDKRIFYDSATASSIEPPEQQSPSVQQNRLKVSAAGLLDSAHHQHDSTDSLTTFAVDDDAMDNTMDYDQQGEENKDHRQSLLNPDDDGEEKEDGSMEKQIRKMLYYQHSSLSSTTTSTTNTPMFGLGFGGDVNHIYHHPFRLSSTGSSGSTTSSSSLSPGCGVHQRDHQSTSSSSAPISPQQQQQQQQQHQILLPPLSINPNFVGGIVRKISMQSIASDDSYFPDLDAKVLVVTHGGPIRELFRYFSDSLNCLFPGGRGNALRKVPNTGISTFMVCYEEGTVSLTCLDLNNKDHLNQQNNQSQQQLLSVASDSSLSPNNPTGGTHQVRQIFSHSRGAPNLCIAAAGPTTMNHETTNHAKTTAMPNSTNKRNDQNDPNEGTPCI